jgi:peroxiredoxin
MALPIGSTAPDFTLKTLGPDGLADVSLSATLAEKAVVLLFFPAAFTGICTDEFCEVSAGFGRYTALDAAVLGISVDSPFSQDAWAKKENISIPLLSDWNKTVTAAYDVIIPNLAGIGDAAARSAFVIGKDGKIAYSEQTPTPKELPDFNAVLKALEGLKQS